MSMTLVLSGVAESVNGSVTLAIAHSDDEDWAQLAQVEVDIFDDVNQVVGKVTVFLHELEAAAQALSLVDRHERDWEEQYGDEEQETA